MKVNLGIEINKGLLKLVAATVRGRDIQVIKHVVKDLATFSESQISSFITDTLTKWQVKVNSASVSIPRNMVTLRNLHLPSQDPSEINQMVQLHIGKIVPYAKEEMIYSYRLGGADEMGYGRITLGILHRDIIDGQMRILESTNIFVDKLVLSSYEIWRGVLKANSSQIKDGQIYILLDIDRYFADFIIFSKEELLFSRGITLKKEDFTGKKATLTKLIGEIRQSLVIFQNEEVNKRPEIIFLAGAAKNVEGLKEALSSELEMEVKEGDCKYRKQIKEDRTGLSGLVSYNSVLESMIEEKNRRLLFVLPELEVRKQLQKKTKELVVLASTLIYSLIFICGIFVTKIYYNNQYLEKIEKEYTYVERRARILKERLKKIQIVRKYIDNRRLPFYLISKLQESVTPELILTEVRLDDDNEAIVQGQALQLSNVFEFNNNLGSIPHFETVKTESTNKKVVDGREMISFKISFYLR